ncbi:MAG: metal ABC transporter permease [Tenuifilum sp.]|uniref:metal ABC transporter permease n=1 Tax=Tenuifilum sp. TaxID=2760880 RepID=UPI001B3E3DDD|nr:metal ABC transporter permease [Bacteroidales bacterium]HOK61252.1 metal ABC transporter permease [Tenuifilum sp.]MBP9029299.1 metal ABC transporter permease [Bacteroidales bacterium]HOK85937.1 metal ABC transporter permease [Tenuifilum sp.]HON70289.1 metal ABC transporter permease [Tenuifilum sp.]
MIEAVKQFFQYAFIQNAIISAFLLSVITGFIGSYIVVRRLVFLSGGITHASFGGIGIAWYFGLNPILGATVFSVFSALGLEYLSQGRTLREDSAIGMLWSFGMAVGILFVFLTPGYAPNLMSFLFGSILTISQTDILLLLILATLTLVFFVAFYYPILFVAFDSDFAKTQNVPVKFISYSLAVLIALSIVFAIRAVGIILIISLLTIPANIANIVTHRFRRIIVLSALISLFSIVAGIAISFRLNVPSGATIIITMMAFYHIAKGIQLVRQRIFTLKV